MRAQSLVACDSKGPTTIGARNRIFQFASVGEDCQDKKYKGERTELIIGDDNVIREGLRYIAVPRKTVVSPRWLAIIC